jgi:hypothetical protein
MGGLQKQQEVKIRPGDPSWSRSVFFVRVTGANPENYVNAFQLRVTGQLGQVCDHHLVSVDIRQLAGIEVEKMMVGTGIRIVKHFDRIHDHFPDQAPSGKQAEGIVDRGFGGSRTEAVDAGQDLIRRQVLWAGKQYFRNLDTLLGRGDADSAQLFPDIPLWLDG